MILGEKLRSGEREPDSSARDQIDLTHGILRCASGGAGFLLFLAVGLSRFGRAERTGKSADHEKASQSVGLVVAQIVGGAIAY
jgi:hypothetical protein